MPRHPPYTLKSLTTFIDHRHAASLQPSEPKSSGPAGRAERVAARTGAAQSITDQQSPKRCSTTPARQKDQSSGGGSTLAGAGVAEVSSFQMNLLLNLKFIHLSKNAYLFTTQAFGRGSVDKFSRRTRVSQPMAPTWQLASFCLNAECTSMHPRVSQGILRRTHSSSASCQSDTSTAFKSSCPSVSVTGSASDLEFQGGTKRCGVMRKGCRSGSKPVFPRCVFLSNAGGKPSSPVRWRSIRNCFDPSRLPPRNFWLR